jgi:Cu/Ag efflux protein CusF
MTMTRTRWLTVTGAGLAALLAVVPAEARSEDPSASEVSGTVERVDRGSKELTLAETGGALTVTPETQIVKGGQRAALADVRQGDEVRASYTESGNTLHVTRIEIVEPPFTDHG